MPRPLLNGAEIINSNHYTFKAIVESALAIPTLVHCVDSHKLVENEFEKLIETHDALISTGGTAISKEGRSGRCNRKYWRSHDTWSCFAA